MTKKLEQVIDDLYKIKEVTMLGFSSFNPKIQNVGDVKAFNDALDIAIEAIKQTTWIPCNERSPKKTGHYWCTFGRSYLTGRDYYTTESDAKEIFDEPEKYAGWQSQNVIAWMPLPKPYKPQESENK